MNVYEYNVGLNAHDMRQAATLFMPEQPNGAAVLMMHGFGSKRDGYAEHAQALGEMLGVVSLTLDLGGHGASEGKTAELSTGDHLAEAQAAYDFLAGTPGVSPDRIGVVGTSFGGYLAVRLTAERPVDSLLLRAPAIYSDGLTDVPDKDRGGAAKERGKLGIPTTFNESLGAAAAFNGTVHIVASGSDEIIPRKVIDAYQSVTGGRVSTIAGAGHALNPKEKQVFKAHMLGWAADL